MCIVYFWYDYYIMSYILWDNNKIIGQQCYFHRNNDIKETSRTVFRQPIGTAQSCLHTTTMPDYCQSLIKLNTLDILLFIRHSVQNYLRVSSLSWVGDLSIMLMLLCDAVATGAVVNARRCLRVVAASGAGGQDHRHFPTGSGARHILRTQWSSPEAYQWLSMHAATSLHVRRESHVSNCSIKYNYSILKV